jgi:hypothetical protein
MPPRDHKLRTMTTGIAGAQARYMDPRVRELVLLALMCALLCGVALMYERQHVAAVFAALACGTVVLAVPLRRLDQ